MLLREPCGCLWHCYTGIASLSAVLYTLRVVTLAFYGAAVLVEMPFFRDCNFFCVRLHAVLLVQLKRLVLGTLGWSTVIVMASLVLEHCKLKHGKLRDFVSFVRDKLRFAH